MGKMRNTMFWYAIYVKSRTEKKVFELLIEKQIEAYIPLLKTVREWSDRKKKIEVPAISGYVFVKIFAEERFKILYTRHVIGFVRFNQCDAIIPDYQIEAMRKIIDQTTYNVEVTFSNLKPGERVEIYAGPFKGLKGTVVYLKRKKWFSLQLDSIQCNLLVDLPLYHLQKEQV